MSTLRTTLTALAALAASLGATSAAASCRSGKTISCTDSSGCAGERTCNSGYWGRCICEVAPQPCQICGRPSFLDANGACTPLPETCNGCDDDGNGVADDGIYCLGTGPFVPRCSVNTRNPWVPFSAGSVLGRLPSNLQAINQYSNNIHYQARLHTNPLVASVMIDFPQRSVNLFDAFYARNLSNGALTDLHDLLNARSYVFPLSGTGQPGGIELHFDTDGAVTDTGWETDGAQVSCGPAGASGAAVIDEDDVDTFGLLTGSDDVVFFQVSAGTDPFSVWTEEMRSSSNGADVDLYARWDALPERNAFDYSSARAGQGDEWIDVDSPRAGHLLYVAAHSRSGGGGFSIRTARVRDEQRWSGAGNSRPLKVGTDFLANADQQARIADMLRGSQRYFVGMTEGKVQLRAVELYVRSGCICDGRGCDVCVHSVAGRAYCAAGVANLFTNQWDHAVDLDRFHLGATVVAHELGHCILGLGDEYRDHGSSAEGCFHGDNRCTASAMANQYDTNNLCTDANHGADTAPFGHVCSSCPWVPASCTVGSCNACVISGPSSWATLLAANKVRSAPRFTPNHRNYQFLRGTPFTLYPR